MCHPKGRSAAKDARSALTRRPARSYSAPTYPPATVRPARRRSGERHERSIPRPPALPAPLADPPIAPQPTHTRLRRAIFGYSHGGGSTYDLCNRLDANRAAIGTFSINFTSYVDGIENDSTIDTDMELRRPPTTNFHANHYQSGSFHDLFLDGGPVDDSEPPPRGLDVETVTWGRDATHSEIDDFEEVRNFIQAVGSQRSAAGVGYGGKREEDPDRQEEPGASPPPEMNAKCRCG